MFKKERKEPDGLAASVTKEGVLDALRKIVDPDLHRDVVSLGMIKNLVIRQETDGALVSFTFELTTPACPVRDQFKSAAEDVVAGLPGVARVQVEMGANVRQSAPGTAQQVQIPNIKNIIAVGSGKGGVGKSTVAANVATALAGTGARVGLLDADIYGPSVPALMGIHTGIQADAETLIPHETYGVKLMSLGFMTDPSRPVIWRGPMVGKAVMQMLTQARWGELDYLIVDLPPGTGDAPLTLIQSIPLSGVVVVTTPQDVATGIATKTLHMFRQLRVPILGIVENMSYFQCPECGHRHHLFSHGGGGDAAKANNVPFLGEIPLTEPLRESGDAGRPIVVSEPEAPESEAFAAIARKVAAQVSIRNSMAIPLAVR